MAPKPRRQYASAVMDEEEIQHQRKSRMAAIALMQKQLDMDDDTLRDLFFNTVGKKSRKAMSLAELTKCRDALVGKGGKLTAPGGKSRALAVDAQAKKLRALWRRGAELGILRDGSEAAMASWASNSRDGNVTAMLAAFTPRQYDEAIERLKMWLRRMIKLGALTCGDHAFPVLDYQVMPVILAQRIVCPLCSDNDNDVVMRWEPRP
jgi:phage gp16-like protein